MERTAVLARLDDRTPHIETVQVLKNDEGYVVLVYFNRPPIAQRTSVRQGPLIVPHFLDFEGINRLMRRTAELNSIEYGDLMREVLYVRCSCPMALVVLATALSVVFGSETLLEDLDNIMGSNSCP